MPSGDCKSVDLHGRGFHHTRMKAFLNRALFVLFCFSVLSAPVFFATGCNLIEVKKDYFKDERVVEAAVTYATLTIIDDNYSKAEAVYHVGQLAMGVLESELVVTVDELHDKIFSMVRWEGVSTRDRILIGNLTELIRDSLAARVESKEIVPEARVYLRQAIGYVLDAAALAGADTDTY